MHPYIYGLCICVALPLDRIRLVPNRTKNSLINVAVLEREGRKNHLPGERIKITPIKKCIKSCRMSINKMFLLLAAIKWSL